MLDRDITAPAANMTPNGCALFSFDPRNEEYYFLSPEIEAMFGALAEKLRRSPLAIADLTTANYRKSLLESWQKLLSEGQRLSLECPVRLDGHTQHWILLHAERLERDGTTMVCGLFQEATQKHDVLEGNRRLRRLFECQNQGWWEWEVNNDTLYPSQYWQELTGHPEPVIHNAYQRINAMIHCDDQERVRAEMIPLLNGEKDLFELELRLQTRYNQTLWLAMNGVITNRNADGRASYVIGQFRDITPRKRAEHIITHVTEGTSLTLGEDFLNQLVEQLAEGLGCCCALVGEYSQQDGVEVITTRALWINGLENEQITYLLKDSPCENVINHHACLYQENIQALFPKDAMLTEISAEGYAGVPLNDSQGRPIGLLAILTDTPIQDISLTESILKMFAGRASAELERMCTREQLQNDRQLFEQITTTAPYAVLMVGPQANVLFANKRARDLPGVIEFNNNHQGRITDSLLNHSGQPLDNRELRRLAQTGHRNIEIATRNADQSLNYMLLHGSPMGGGHNAVVISIVDVTEQYRINDQQKLIANVIESAQDGVIITDPSMRILTVNKAFTTITGYTQAEAIGNTPRMLQSGRQNKTFYNKLWSQINKTGTWQGELWNKRKDGSIYPETVTISEVLDKQGKVANYFAVFRDESEAKQSEHALQWLSSRDSLTQLPNRHTFQSRLIASLERCVKQNNQCAVMLLDLDRFKTINDSLGHELGDKLLQLAAGRLLNVLRKEDCVARLSGDEFAILLDPVTDTQNIQIICEKLLEAFRKPFHIEDHDYFAHASIGVCCYPEDASSEMELMRGAEAAMYRTKHHGGNGYEFFSSDLNREVQNRIFIETSLHQAVEQNQIQLYYQPQIGLASGDIVGAEVLVRWNHPERGMIPPMEFITIAEEIGLIRSLGDQVLERACRQMVTWLDQGIDIGCVAVNVSAKQVDVDYLPARVASILRETGLAPHYLELELTESALLQQPEKAIACLQQLDELGVTLAIDDFGTGYSSLSYLKQLPIKKLKIDRSFVSDLPGDQDDASITRAVVSMSRSLELEVIAEGVEQPEQAAFLADLGCHEVQGYLYSRPLPTDEFLAWVKDFKQI